MVLTQSSKIKIVFGFTILDVLRVIDHLTFIMVFWDVIID